MRDPKRIDKVCDALKKTWKSSPYNDMRFGQFISNFMGFAMSEYKISDIWFPEDDKWIEYLEAYKDFYTKKKED